MPIEVKMPALSPTMEKGTLARWLVGVGDTVKAGDLLAEIETDKATMEFEAADAGRIAQLTVPAGTDEVRVGTVIALLAEAGEAIGESDLALAASEAAPSAPEAASTPEPAPAPAPQDAHPPLAIDAAANATPLARRIAAARGTPLSGITGSGPRGLIVKADLGLPALTSALAPALAPIPAAAPAVPAPPPEGIPVETTPLSPMRRTIARRLTQSKQQVPHFYLSIRCDIDPLLRLRAELNAGLAARGIKLSVNDFMIKALALALGAVPEANVQYGGDVLHRFARVDIAMAVAIDGGLVTPVIRDAGELSLTGIAQASQALAARAREGRLQPADYAGGTASISNLGMFRIDEMIPVLNPPQAVILGVGAGIEQPWKVGTAIALATVATLTASFDHRAIDGATAARFMTALRALIDDPLLLVA